MSDDISLFDLPEPSAHVVEPPIEHPILAEQIQHIREAFEVAGIASQDKRKKLIESVVNRQVASLRELRRKEGSLILRALRTSAEAKPKPKSTGSAWDDREEETWIDKL